MNEKYTSHQNREFFPKEHEHVEKEDVCTFQDEFF